MIPNFPLGGEQEGSEVRLDPPGQPDLHESHDAAQRRRLDSCTPLTLSAQKCC